MTEPATETVVEAPAPTEEPAAVDETPAAAEAAPEPVVEDDTAWDEPEVPAETPAEPEAPEPAVADQPKQADSAPEDHTIPRDLPLQVELDNPWGDLPVQKRHYEDGTPAF